MPEVVDNNKLEKEEEDGNEEEEEEVKAPKAKGHDSGSADLEKVTDYAEDKEILSTGKDLEDALQAIRNKQAQKTAEKVARERELAKVVIAKEDVELIVQVLHLRMLRNRKYVCVCFRKWRSQRRRLTES